MLDRATSPEPKHTLKGIASIRYAKRLGCLHYTSERPQTHRSRSHKMTRSRWHVYKAYELLTFPLFLRRSAYPSRYAG